MYLFIRLSVLITAFLSLNLHAQTGAPLSRETARKLHGGAENIVWTSRTTDHPLLGTSLVPLVKVYIQGRGPFLFLLDTGSDLILLQEKTALEAGLELPGGNTGPGVIHLPELSIGEVKFRGLLAGLKTWEGPVDGILGFNVFLGTQLTVDLPRMRFAIDPPADKKKDDLNTVRMELGQTNLPEIPVRLGGKKNKLIISTGTTDYLRAPETGLELFSLKIPPLPAVSTSSFPVEENLKMTRVADDLVLGSHIIMEPVLTVGDSDDFLIGTSLLRYFRVVIDTENSWVSFLRTTDVPIEIPSIRQLGFIPAADDTGWYIKSIHGWMASLGLNIQEGDRIVMVNSMDAAGMQEKDWVELERLNNQLTLVLSREGREIMLEMPLRILLP